MLKPLVALIFVFFSFAFVGETVSQSGGLEIPDVQSALPCASGERKLCGSDIGECRSGVRTCENSQWSECTNSKGPAEEVCGNSLDDNCNGSVDECVNLFWVWIAVGVIVALGFVWILSRI